MISSIAGDMIGSRYEFHNSAPIDALFSDKSVYTDDTVLTIATADVLLNGGSYAKNYLDYAINYPNRGYGSSFAQAIKRKTLEPYDSYGNGSAMRVSPVGWVYNNINDTAKEAKKSAECSHNHLEGMKGAVSVACAIWLARNGYKKEQIKYILEKDPLGYDLSTKMADFPKKFDVTCQGTIPRCMAIFLETDNFEDAMIAGIRMGGDVDTNCCIVGGICNAYYGLPSKEIIEAVYSRLPLQMAKITTDFTIKYVDKNFKEPQNVASKASTMEDAISAMFG